MSLVPSWFGVNVFGIGRVSAAAMPFLKKSKVASIVNTCSIAATAGISIIGFLLPQAALTIGAIFLVALVGLSFIAAFSSARVKYRDHSDKLFDQIMQSCDSSQESQIFYEVYKSYQ